MEYKSPLSKKKRKEDVLTDKSAKKFYVKMNLKVNIFNLIPESSHDSCEIARIVQETVGQDDTVSIKIDQKESLEASNTDLLICFSKKFCQNEVSERESDDLTKISPKV